MTEKTQTEMPIASIKIEANFRQSMNKDTLKELAANISRVGVLVPLLVRKNGDGESHILIAGHRRLAAAKEAKLKTVPVRVLDVTEAEAKEIQAFENLHRDDLTAMEEARAFKTLIETHSIEQLAGKVNKSPKYVYRALALLDLPKKAIDALENGKMTPAHAHQIIRVDEDCREKVVDFILMRHDGSPVAIGDVERFISGQIARDLSKAIFPKDEIFGTKKDDEAIVENACVKCQFNTGNQGMLFEGAEKGKCTNPPCFSAKTKLFYREIRVETSEKTHLKMHATTTVDYNGQAPSIIKGAVVVNPKDAKVKALMEKSPDKFGFVIVKPSQWNSSVKPKTVIVCKDPKTVGVKVEKKDNGGYDTAKWERQRVAEELTLGFLRLDLWLTLDVEKDAAKIMESVWRHYNAEPLAPVFMAVGIVVKNGEKFPTSKVAALPAATRVKLLVTTLIILEVHNADELGKTIGLNVAKRRQEAYSQVDQLAKTTDKKEPATA